MWHRLNIYSYVGSILPKPKPVPGAQGGTGFPTMENSTAGAVNVAPPNQDDHFTEIYMIIVIILSTLLPLICIILSAAFARKIWVKFHDQSTDSVTEEIAPSSLKKTSTRKTSRSGSRLSPQLLSKEGSIDNPLDEPIIVIEAEAVANSSHEDNEITIDIDDEGGFASGRSSFRNHSLKVDVEGSPRTSHRRSFSDAGKNRRKSEQPDPKEIKQEIMTSTISGFLAAPGTKIRKSHSMRYKSTEQHEGGARPKVAQDDCMGNLKRPNADDEFIMKRSPRLSQRRSPHQLHQEEHHPQVHQTSPHSAHSSQSGGHHSSQSGHHSGHQSSHATNGHSHHSSQHGHHSGQIDHPNKSGHHTSQSSHQGSQPGQHSNHSSSGHHSSQSGHHSGQSVHHSGQSAHHSSQSAHHSSLSGHHSNQSGHHFSQSGHHSSQSGHPSSQSEHHSSHSGQHSSQSGHSSSQTGHHSSQSGHHSSQSGHHSSQSGHHSGQSSHQQGHRSSHGQVGHHTSESEGHHSGHSGNQRSISQSGGHSTHQSGHGTRHFSMIGKEESPIPPPLLPDSILDDTEVDAETLDAMADEIVELLVQEEEAAAAAAANFGRTTSDISLDDPGGTNHPSYQYGNQIPPYSAK